MRLTGLIPLLQVFDMPRALAFYRDGLSFAVVAHSPEVETAEGRFHHWMWLKNGAVELMLNTAYDSGERPAVLDASRWAGHGDVTLFIGCQTIDAMHAELTARGLPVGPVSDTPHGLRQMSLTDPDGYVICFQASRSS